MYLVSRSWNWADAYLRLEHAERLGLYRMLRQAMMARQALLLIDGLDEGGSCRAAIERHVLEVLAPQGHVILCTSRPAGVDDSRFSGFHRLQLAPLTARSYSEERLAQYGLDYLILSSSRTNFTTTNSAALFHPLG